MSLQTINVYREDHKGEYFLADIQFHLADKPSQGDSHGISYSGERTIYQRDMGWVMGLESKLFDHNMMVVQKGRQMYDRYQEHLPVSQTFDRWMIDYYIPEIHDKGLDVPKPYTEDEMTWNYR